MAVSVKTKKPIPPPEIEEIVVTCAITEKDIMTVSCFDEECMYITTSNTRRPDDSATCVGVTRADWLKLVEICAPWANS